MPIIAIVGKPYSVGDHIKVDLQVQRENGEPSTPFTILVTDLPPGASVTDRVMIQITKF